jgi:hypothetical protein
MRAQTGGRAANSTGRSGQRACKSVPFVFLVRGSPDGTASVTTFDTRGLCGPRIRIMPGVGLTMFFPVSPRERLLLNAAISPDADAAVASWQNWAAQIKIEEAPDAEVRLLNAVHENLSRVADSFPLPKKLAGIAKATFIQNNYLARECLPVIEALSERCPVLIAKGLAMCIRLGTWPSRSMGDTDIHVPFAHLNEAADFLAKSGWTPQFGMTWKSLVYRTVFRRSSWNLTKGGADLDLHWRSHSGAENQFVTKRMWSTAERFNYFGRSVFLQSVEFAVITALDHGFVLGAHTDRLQAVIDTSRLFPLCRADVLMLLVAELDLADAFGVVASTLREAGFSTPLPDARRPHAAVEGGRRRALAAKPIPAAEEPVLCRPMLYRLWERLGRKPWLERFLVRWAGPFSKPLDWSPAFKDDYDLRDCAAIDRIGGPGWGWPEPEHTCFWTDRADARLLIPLRAAKDHIILLGAAKERLHSPNRRVNVFANGFFIRSIDFGQTVATSQYALRIPRRVLFKNFVELSLRPLSYRGSVSIYAKDYVLMRSVPVFQLRIFEGNDIDRHHGMDHDTEQREACQLKRVMAKAEASPFKNSPDLPEGFNPRTYVLNYFDLLEAEIDPFEHFLKLGQFEERRWQ